MADPGFTIDQQRAMALASARLRLQESQSASTEAAPPPKPLTRDVQNPIDEAITGFLADRPGLTSTLERQIGRGSPTAGLALGAASLPLGALQMGIRGLGGDDSAIRDIYQNRERAMGGGFDAPQLAGAFLNPLPIKAAAGMPMAASTGERIRQGMMLGAGIGASSPVTDEGNFLAGKGAQIAGGTMIGGAIPGFLAAGGAALRTGRNVIDPWLPGGTQRSAARAVEEAAGPRLPQVMSELQKNQVIVPGSQPTAAEAATAAGSTELAGLQSVVKGSQPSQYRDIGKAQEAARLAQIESIGQTPQALEAAVTARGAQAAKDYGAAYAQQIKADPQLMAISDNPYFKNALPTALDLAKANGINPKTNLTEFLHYVKLGLDDQLSGTARQAIGRSEQRAVGEVKDSLVQWLAKTNPAYDVARRRFATASKPINEMQVGQELIGAMRSPTDVTERANVFANAVRNAPQTIKSATGNARYENLGQVLTPQNVQKVDEVFRDMARKGEFEKMAQAGMQRAREITGGIVPEVPAAGMFNPKYSVMRAIVNRLSGKVEGESLKVLTQALQTPQGTLDLLQHLPPQTARQVMSQMGMLGERGAVIGITDLATQ